jgi:hypothetical protein
MVAAAILRFGARPTPGRVPSALASSLRHVPANYSAKLSLFSCDLQSIRRSSSNVGLWGCLSIRSRSIFSHVFGHLGDGPGDFPEAERAAAETLAIPMYAEIIADQQLTVVERDCRIPRGTRRTRQERVRSTDGRLKNFAISVTASQEEAFRRMQSPGQIGCCGTEPVPTR